LYNLRSPVSSIKKAEEEGGVTGGNYRRKKSRRGINGNEKDSSSL